MTVEHNSRRLTHMQLAAEVLQSFGTVRLEVRGPSMLPCIFPGDILTIERRAGREIECGDVVLYLREERFFVHRVVAKTKTFCLITRGDALVQDDPPVLESQLLGRVILIQRGDKCWRVRRHTGGLTRLLQHSIRHSDMLTRSLLRWHSLRRRVQNGLRCLSLSPVEGGL